MPTNFLVAIKSALGARTNNARYETVSQALESAKILLDEGAPSVWIIDSQGNLILPADQIRLRLSVAGAASGEPHIRS